MSARGAGSRLRTLVQMARRTNTPPGLGNGFTHLHELGTAACGTATGPSAGPPPLSVKLPGRCFVSCMQMRATIMMQT